jgi:hypothetical protein
VAARSGVLEYLQEEAEKVRLPPPGTMVRLRAPRGWDEPGGFDKAIRNGRHHAVEDGLVEVDGGRSSCCPWDLSESLKVGAARASAGS